MILTRLRRSSAIVLVGVLSGCASAGAYQTAGIAGVTADTVAEQDRLGKAVVGSVITLPGTDTSMRVTHEYRAASGRFCRRLEPTDHTVGWRVACREGNGEWQLRRSLSDSGDVFAGTMSERQLSELGPRSSMSSQPEQAQSDHLGADSMSDSAASLVVTTSLMQIQSGETLWAFARRTTGSGVHWDAIAELNGLDQPEQVKAGTELKVPDSLRRRER